jgi:hypothetical protein
MLIQVQPPPIHGSRQSAREPYYHSPPISNLKKLSLILPPVARHARLRPCAEDDIVSVKWFVRGRNTVGMYVCLHLLLEYKPQ